MSQTSSSSESPRRSLNDLTKEEAEILDKQMEDNIILKPAKVAPERGDRITSVLNFYHETQDDPTEGVRVAMSLNLEEKIQPYIRRLTIGNDWTPLDMGWVHKPGYMVIENTTRVNPQRVPTPEEVKAVSETIVQIGCETDRYEKVLFWIRPGTFIVAELDPGFKPILRSLKGQAKINLTLVSK